VPGSGDLKSQLTSLGLSGLEIKVGQIYVLPDGDIKFPANELNRAKGTGVHVDRTAAVIQDGPALRDPLCKMVYIAPTSSQTHLKTANDIELAAGEGGLHKDSICMLDHVQPVLKSHLKTCCGRLENPRVEEILTLHAAIMRGEDDSAEAPTEGQ